jgi:cell wall-associated NlpC family hydrolase
LAKHRRPTRLQQLGQMANHNPVHLGIAAGIAGTLTVTGSVVAHASPTSGPGAAAKAEAKPQAVAHGETLANDLGVATNAVALRDAVDTAAQERAEALAKAKARAEARRKAAKERRERRAAERRAAEARQTQAASRGIERMSASAANVLRIAAQAASGAYYRYGGTGPSGFDCSGFTSYVFSKVGVSLPHSSSAQRSAVKSVSNPQPGDLVFVYNGGGGSVGHVAIYAGNGYWWEASNPSMGVGKHRAWSSNVSYGRVL